MASSFIDYEGRGFWIKDDILEIALGYVCIAISHLKDPSHWLLEMQQLFKDNSLGYYSSYMHLNLEEFLGEESSKTSFLNVLDNTREIVIAEGDMLDLTILNRYICDEKLKDVWQGKVEQQRVLKVISYLNKLVSGEIKTLPSDPIDYFF